MYLAKNRAAAFPPLISAGTKWSCPRLALMLHFWLGFKDVESIPLVSSSLGFSCSAATTQPPSTSAVNILGRKQDRKGGTSWGDNVAWSISIFLETCISS